MKFPHLTDVITLVAQGKTFYPVPAPAPDELLVGPYEKFVSPGMGLGLLVPSETCVVVVTSENRLTLREGPQWLSLKAGFYHLYTVSLRKHSLTLIDVRAPTGDSYTITLSLNMDWEAAIPELVTRIPYPLARLDDLCRGAIMRVITQYTHEKLVGTPEKPVHLNGQLTDAISDLLKRSRHSTGITVSNLSLQKLVGDASIMRPQLEKAAAIERGKAARQTAELRGATEQQEAETAFKVAQWEHQQKLIPELLERVYRDHRQDRQWGQERILTALNSLSQLAAGLSQNTMQEMLTPEFQPFPPLTGDTLIKALEAILAEINHLALAAPSTAKAINAEELIQSYNQMLQGLRAVQDAPQPDSQRLTHPVNGNPAKVAAINRLPRAE